MNGTNGNEPGYPENALVPYPVIVVATKKFPNFRICGRWTPCWKNVQRSGKMNILDKV